MIRFRKRSVYHLSTCTARRLGYALHWHSITSPRASAPRITEASGSCLVGTLLAVGSPFFQLVSSCSSMRRPFSTSCGDVSWITRIKWYLNYGYNAVYNFISSSEFIRQLVDTILFLLYNNYIFCSNK